MKQIIIPLLAGVMFACTQAPAQKLEFKEHLSKEFTIKESAAKNTLAIYNIFGSIKVKGYNGDKVVIEVDKTITADDKETLDEGKNEFKVNFEQKGDSVLAYISAPFDSRPNRNNHNWNNEKKIEYHYNLEYTVKVPFAMDLRVSTVNNGDVLVEDIAGLLHVSNVNGAIKLTNAKGAAEVKTINGNVDANYLAVPPGESQFKTLNGNITITYPQSLSADCQFKSFNGEFYTDFPDTETLPVKLVKNQETNHNKTTYKVNAETAIRIGKGGQIFKFETFNGNIYLKKQS
ncbi:DUF4097 family beta strand repeat-containing protein [Dyadobacter frigoris]|uniref:DUF4097 domain-containing protein n=1 Tax=Dyadobacter frigoris TaxID=2576211 RepID=A0A4V6BI24_9BACT|nr:DUF4097 family beta strand repeat-containing protein [Dyadobacter frigoris]TKT87473.1 hypothetical protein FDK13_29595 [Dyadobacter frigoris]GLU52275.1 hypothetical protein Dfri01_17360 [Dyadobacter frigoris]